MTPEEAHLRLRLAAGRLRASELMRTSGGPWPAIANAIAVGFLASRRDARQSVPARLLEHLRAAFKKR